MGISPKHLVSGPLGCRVLPPHFLRCSQCASVELVPPCQADAGGTRGCGRRRRGERALLSSAASRACMNETVFLTMCLRGCFGFPSSTSVDRMSGGAAPGAAPVKTSKRFRDCWRTTFPRQWAAVDLLVDLFTEEWTVAKLQALKKVERKKLLKKLVASVELLLPDAWKTSQLKKENFTPADCFVRNALSRWRRKKGQGACIASKNTPVPGGIRYDHDAYHRQQRCLFNAGTIVADPIVRDRVVQVLFTGLQSITYIVCNANSLDTSSD